MQNISNFFMLFWLSSNTEYLKPIVLTHTEQQYHGKTPNYVTI